MHTTDLFKTLVVALAAGLLSLSASAEWMWIDKSGRKVFSDRPPPADIQEKDILRRPAGATGTAPASSATANDTGTAADVKSALPAAAVNKTGALALPKLSGKDKELEGRKKQAEEAEAAKKKVDEDKAAQTKAENCERARQNMAALKSGTRMSSVNAKGEPEIFDDTKRAAETKRTQSAIDSNCQ